MSQWEDEYANDMENQQFNQIREQKVKAFFGQPTVSKMEIAELSDEEIDNGFEHFRNQHKEYKLGLAKYNIWFMACQWYREQLKSKQ